MARAKAARGRAVLGALRWRVTFLQRRGREWAIGRSVLDLRFLGGFVAANTSTGRPQRRTVCPSKRFNS
jgi:hypothetical protein